MYCLRLVFPCCCPTSPSHNSPVQASSKPQSYPQLLNAQYPPQQPPQYFQFHSDKIEKEDINEKSSLIKPSIDTLREQCASYLQMYDVCFNKNTSHVSQTSSNTRNKSPTTKLLAKINQAREKKALSELFDKIYSSLEGVEENPTDKFNLHADQYALVLKIIVANTSRYADIISL